LNEESAKAILENIVDYSSTLSLPVFKIGLVGAGEPLLSFDLLKYIVEWAEQNDHAQLLSFYTITNGTLVTEAILDFFLIHRDRIALNFSLDGYEELHNYGRMAFDKVMAAIALYKKVLGEYPRINCTVNRQTINNKENTLAFFKANDLNHINFSEIFDCDDSNLTISHQDYLDFLDYIAKDGAIVFRQSIKEKHYDCQKYGRLCGVGRTNIFITAQGIYPCGRFYKNETYKLGEYDTPLALHEKTMIQKLRPTQNGACYYDMYIVKKEIQK
jgi:uncharacterized protein